MGHAHDGSSSQESCEGTSGPGCEEEASCLVRQTWGQNPALPLPQRPGNPGAWQPACLLSGGSDLWSCQVHAGGKYIAS